MGVGDPYGYKNRNNHFLKCKAKLEKAQYVPEKRTNYNHNL